jgi:Na+-translocating ferredoxin:NAD+ oxidoreductase subunit B
MNAALALFVMVALSGLFVLAHRWLDHLQRSRSDSARERLIDAIDSLLPQTQCGRCTFAGCKPYATALAHGDADINQCPPGGRDTASALARLLQRPVKDVDPRFGVMPTHPMVAVIDESACIGCTKCIQACPVDAIVGAARYMHTVIADHCTGCELCIPPCPVDCIDMRPAPTWRAESLQRSA